MASRPDSVPAPITGNQWHAVVLELVGESLVLTVDGRPALTTTWPARSRAGSRIEFLVHRGSAEFRNVRIWGATSRRDLRP
ncbi:MAG: hypothetical protein Q7S40_20030 [Opitutaceae bacterium]|nr:hypothetical protein [Opitutaceae bacterium]